jgi:hypothetical protein
LCNTVVHPWTSGAWAPHFMRKKGGEEVPMSEKQSPVIHLDGGQPVKNKK